MPALQIDGHKISIEEGRTILDAARQAGIEIPTLCWYPMLSIVGNCRICLVSVEGQPKLIPACATKVADGLVVTTRSHAAVEKRRAVLKLLAERYPAEHLRNGMSTCILCTRCVRACEDIQVVGVLDVGWRGEHAEIIVGADGDPDKAGCTWCGEIVRVTSPDIELNTPNQGSTCVKGRFGYDFPQHRDRLVRPLIRKGWTKENGRWVWKGPKGADRRGGPWRTIEAEGQRPKPGTPPRATGKTVRELPLLDRIDMDIRDRVATPDDWYSPFREATWDEALELTAQELLRIKRARGANSLACFSSAKCSNEENYLIMRMFRGALGTNNVDHCTRLCHSTSVAAMQRAINTAAASGSMREIEQACDVIFIAGANTTESHPVFGAALKRAHEK